jgi:demethylmenaquinone methyltransferase/2-methoxy-6-polyprenyl-1,4-benzoquinol methylase
MARMKADMADYYARRAAEYERIYRKPERQDDLRILAEEVKRLLAGRDVLEVACGTGYWTHIIAEEARSILATDLNQETTQVALAKSYGRCPVDFRKADAYSLSDIPGVFNAAFCGFWWSHVPRSQESTFLRNIHSKLQPQSLVLMIDNNYVEGSSTPISRRDGEGHTYQIRKLDDGTEHEVLKNFPDETDFRNSMEGQASVVDFARFKYFWLAHYLTA